MLSYAQNIFSASLLKESMAVLVGTASLFD